MRGKDEKLLDIFNSNGKRFIIPAYQRNYDWKQENCERLFDDLIALTKSRREGHFFGSVVTVESEDGFSTERLVIDGQQRVTTVSLLLLAMYRLLERGEVVSTKGDLKDHIYNCYLVDNTSARDIKLRLKPVKSDQLAFEKLFADEEEHLPNSNLTINYNYFVGRIRKNEISIDDLFRAVRNLVVINVELKQADDPQLVFESLNSTGVALTEGDKIRNFVLMGLSSRQQDTFYEKYWNRIEECTGYEVSAFIRDYLSVKTNVIASQNKVYESFKAYRQKLQDDPEELLQDMYAYSKLYRTLLVGKTSNRNLNDCIFRLNWLETSVTRPFLLEVLRLESEGKLKTDDVAEIFATVEAYLYRRQICEIPTNALNKIFLGLHKEIAKFDGTVENYLSKFKYAIGMKRDRGVFPSDKDFIAAFKTRNVYKMNPRVRAYTLERLENFGTRETVDVYKRIEEDTLTIEHVMPQVLVPEWMESLGDDYAEIHEAWLHRVANLTLTAYNSRYSNNPFADKLNMKNGFKDSGVRLNHWIAQQTEWGEKQLIERTELLAERALEIWPTPDTASYTPVEKEKNTVTLDDDVSFRGLQISGFVFRGVEQSVLSWIDMFDAVIRQLHSTDKSILAKLAAVKDPEVKLSQYFTTDGSGLREATELDTGVFYERNSNTEIKVTILRELFRQFGVGLDDLVLILRDGSEDKSSESVKAWHEMRRRYWTYALPKMSVANAENGMFSGSSPSEENWTCGFFGVGGVHISCIANYNCARVELYANGASKLSAKELFDELDRHRFEIEKALGADRVYWNRGNDIKHARIFVRSDDLSINNESDWERMAEYHSVWSKKIYDVLVPYVRDYVRAKTIVV